MKVIGHWANDDHPDLPHPRAFVDPTWNAEQRQAVANYLNAGRPVAERGHTGEGCSPCRLCGVMNGSDDFTDGVYLWPEGLAHYVADHSVRLPEEVVQHALSASVSGAAVRWLDRTWWTGAMATGIAKP